MKGKDILSNDFLTLPHGQKHNITKLYKHNEIETKDYLSVIKKQLLHQIGALIYICFTF